MSTATQQRTYTTGLNVTATILNTEFGNIITNLNTLYGFIDDNTGSAPITVDTTNTYVGIGTTSPTTGLDIDTSGLVSPGSGLGAIKIVDEDYNGGIDLEMYHSSDDGPFIKGLGGRGNIASPTATQDDGTLIRILGRGIDNGGSETSTVGAIRLKANENFTTTNQATKMTIDLVALGGSTTLTEVFEFRYGNGGNAVLRGQVGDTVLESATGDIIAVSNFKPSPDNTYDLGSLSARWDDVYATNGTIQTSDGEDKEDITEASLGLNFIAQLRPVEYKWKKSYKKLDGEFVEKSSEEKRKHIGLIAQEVESVLDGADFAGLVKDDETGKYGLRYNEFIPVLIKSIQELQAEVERLKK